MTEAIRYEKGQDRIVVLTIDMPGQSANTMNAVYRDAMAACVARLVADKELGDHLWAERGRTCP